MLQPLFWILCAVEIDGHLAVGSSLVAGGAGLPFRAVAVADGSRPALGADIVLPPVGSTLFGTVRGVFWRTQSVHPLVLRDSLPLVQPDLESQTCRPAGELLRPLRIEHRPRRTLPIALLHRSKELPKLP